MKLRTKYILVIGLLHLITLVISFYIFRQNQLLFIISEVFIIISILFSWQLYNQLIQPLKTLLSGIDALKSRDFNIKFRKTGKYEMDELIEVYNRMTDQLRIERTVQEQQHFFLEKLIFTSPTGIIILDYNNKIERINPKALQVLGISENNLIGVYISEIDHPVLQQVSLLRSGESNTISIAGVKTYKLQVSHFIDRGFARNFVMIEELTAEILAAEKKVYEKVIRMMAHEVNNTIGPVNSIISSTLRTDDIWQNDQHSTLHNALQIAVDRNNNLNGFMRNFADLVKLPQPNKKRIELRRLIQNVVQLMTLKAQEKGIEFKLDLQDTDFIIMADEQQMEQALINIVKNGIEAIDGPGQIILYADPSAKKLVITDTGKGISEEDADKLFSPFFSTKKDGQGIGLTLVREILSNHSFSFSLKTMAPNQTEFIIQF